MNCQPEQFMNGVLPKLIARLLGLSMVGLAGCAAPTVPGNPLGTAVSLPAEALVTERAVLTARGRDFTLNGYLAQSATSGQRLIITEMFGQVLADVLVKPDGTTQVMRSSKLLRRAWIEQYVAQDMRCIFGDAPAAHCQIEKLSPTHFIIRRRWYKLDLQIVEIKPGPQPKELFDETGKEPL